MINRDNGAKGKIEPSSRYQLFVSFLSGTKTPLLKDAALRNIGYKAQHYFPFFLDDNI